MAEKKAHKKPAGKKLPAEIQKLPKHSKSFEPPYQLVFEADEFHYYPKDKFWTFGIGVLLFGLIMGAIVIKDYLAILVCVMAAVVFFQHGYTKPKKYQVEIRTDGIMFRDKFYPYTELKSFWLVEEPNRILYLEQARLHFPLTVLLGEQSAEEIRTFLLRYLPEHPIGKEHITDKLARFLRF